ncbi:hypothetical protein [Aliivibrio finisterrensis]|uniref:Uncharacterized protein n=1 Tax=Aliivibrio finisterrensis TaxID=511998 RepID=A0A4Q5KYT2_9GAMM|nr:hypothetical protein [Aliivibrio finisterrensis]RYU53334.1 hypothetical protein ERW57_04185 [Aliivibrio finisterrensis]
MDKLVLTKLQETIIAFRKELDIEYVDDPDCSIQDVEKAQSMHLVMVLPFAISLISDTQVINGLSELLLEHMNRSMIESAIGATADVYSDINRDTLKFVTKAAVQAKAA